MVVKDFEKCSISRQTLLMLLMQTLQVNELLPSNGVPFRPGPAASLRTVWQFSCAVWSCCQLDGPDTCSQPTDRHSSSAVAGFRHQCRGVTEARCLGFIIRQIRSHRLFSFFLKGHYWVLCNKRLRVLREIWIDYFNSVSQRRWLLQRHFLWFFLVFFFSVRQLLEYFLNRRAVFAAPSNTVF